jgi:DNA repair ATPase RecN
VQTDEYSCDYCRVMRAEIETARAKDGELRRVTEQKQLLQSQSESLEAKIKEYSQHLKQSYQEQLGEMSKQCNEKLERMQTAHE